MFNLSNIQRDSAKVLSSKERKTLRYVVIFSSIWAILAANFGMYMAMTAAH